jgi:AbrB family looped-hinge helix DNA binding protein
LKEIVMTMTSKGQVTIPAEVRRHLGLQKNQKIALVIEDKGTVRLKVPRYPNVASLSGAAGQLSKELSWNEMRAIAREDHWKAKTKKHHG